MSWKDIIKNVGEHDVGDMGQYTGPRSDGPWKYEREADTEDGDFRIYITAPPYGVTGRIAKMLGEHTYADAQLMADAPLLLEEVKRLRKALADIADEKVIE